MSKVAKHKFSMTPPVDASLPDRPSAVLPKPNVTGTDAEIGAGSNRRTGRALDTAKRGWRWMLISSLLLLLPYSVFAAQGLENSGLNTQPVVIDGGLPFVSLAGDLELGVHLTTLDEVITQLRRASRTRRAAPHWIDVYFNTVNHARPAEPSADLIPIPGRVAAEMLGLFKYDGRI